MDITAADLTFSHLNHRITVQAWRESDSWSTTGRLTLVEFTSYPDDEEAVGDRQVRLALGLGDTRATLELDPKHPVTVHEAS